MNQVFFSVNMTREISIPMTFRLYHYANQFVEIYREDNYKVHIVCFEPQKQQIKQSELPFLFFFIFAGNQQVSTK